MATNHLEELWVFYKTSPRWIIKAMMFSETPVIISHLKGLFGLYWLYYPSENGPVNITAKLWLNWDYFVIFRNWAGHKWSFELLYQISTSRNIGCLISLDFSRERKKKKWSSSRDNNISISPLSIEMWGIKEADKYWIEHWTLNHSCYPKLAYSSLSKIQEFHTKTFFENYLLH